MKELCRGKVTWSRFKRIASTRLCKNLIKRFDFTPIVYRYQYFISYPHPSKMMNFLLSCPHHLSPMTFSWPHDGKWHDNRQLDSEDQLWHLNPPPTPNISHQSLLLYGVVLFICYQTVVERNIAKYLVVMTVIRKDGTIFMVNLESWQLHGMYLTAYLRNA